MNEKYDKREKKARQYLAAGSVIGTVGVAAALNEVAEQNTVTAVAAATIAVAGVGLAVYEGIHLAAAKYVRDNHDKFNYDRTHEKPED